MTAVSIPDPIFDAADQVADRLGFSRSKLYARALTRRPGALNPVYGRHSSKLDPVLEKIQYVSLIGELSSRSMARVDEGLRLVLAL